MSASVRRSENPGPRPTVSVVIAAIDRRRLLVRQLDALARQGPQPAFEVIVADNGCADATLRSIATFRDRLDLRVIDATARRGSPFARNKGAWHARGDQLLFLDEDDEVGAGYVAAMAQALAHHTVVAGRLDIRALNPRWQAARRSLEQTRGVPVSRHRWAMAAALGIRKAAFVAVGGFDEDLARSHEDLDLGWRLAEAGHEIEFVPQAVLNFRLRHRAVDVVTHERRYALGAADFHRKHPDAVPTSSRWAWTTYAAGSLLRLALATDPAMRVDGWTGVGICLGGAEVRLRSALHTAGRALAPTPRTPGEAQPGVDADLIYDVGAHRGEDTAFYLSRGFRVVAVEANPALVDGLRSRFAAEVRSGRVVIVPVAVGPRRGTTRLTVAADATADATVFGTADPAFRDALERRTVPVGAVDVDTVTIGDIIERHGTPYYLKVDIEGMDGVVVAGLSPVAVRPPLLSIESVTAGPKASLAGVVSELLSVRRLGYRRFKLVDQSNLSRLRGRVLDREGAPVVYDPPLGASGPFGDEVPGRWRGLPATAAHMLARLLQYQALAATGWFPSTAIGRRLRSRTRALAKAVAPGVAVGTHLGGYEWYDLHCTMLHGRDV